MERLDLSLASSLPNSEACSHRKLPTIMKHMYARFGAKTADSLQIRPDDAKLHPARAERPPQPKHPLQPRGQRGQQRHPVTRQRPRADPKHSPRTVVLNGCGCRRGHWLFLRGRDHWSLQACWLQDQEGRAPLSAMNFKKTKKRHSSMNLAPSRDQMGEEGSREETLYDFAG